MSVFAYSTQKYTTQLQKHVKRRDRSSLWTFIIWLVASKTKQKPHSLNS